MKLGCPRWFPRAASLGLPWLIWCAQGSVCTAASLPAWARGGEARGDGTNSGGAVGGHEIPAWQGPPARTVAWVLQQGCKAAAPVFRRPLRVSWKKKTGHTPTRWKGARLCWCQGNAPSLHQCWIWPSLLRKWRGIQNANVNRCFKKHWNIYKLQQACGEQLLFFSLVRCWMYTCTFCWL